MLHVATARAGGKHLARVHHAVGIERTAQTVLVVEVVRTELASHELALLEADAVLTGQHAARGERRLDEPANTVTSKLPRWTDGTEYLRLTDAEASALQSYPADFKWVGKRGPIAQQIGNAVPPLLAECILATLLDGAA